MNIHVQQYLLQRQIHLEGRTYIIADGDCMTPSIDDSLACNPTYLIHDLTDDGQYPSILTAIFMYDIMYVIRYIIMHETR